MATCSIGILRLGKWLIEPPKAGPTRREAARWEVAKWGLLRVGPAEGELNEPQNCWFGGVCCGNWPGCPFIGNPV